MKHHIVFFTGAGISQESGLQTFRDSEGLWNNHKIEDIASPIGFEKNPQQVLDFYNERRKELLKVKPNLAHKLIASLEDRYDVTVITQNIDNLHERGGSKNVLHLHGELLKSRSSSDKNLIYDCQEDIKLGDLCEKGSQIRPHVVWFGEEVHNIYEAEKIVASADIFVIVGTTMAVHPAALLLLKVPVDVQTVYIDLNPDIEEGINLHVIKDKATNGMKHLVEDLLPY